MNNQIKTRKLLFCLTVGSFYGSILKGKIKPKTNVISGVFALINYQKEFEKIVKENTTLGLKPSVLLHSCCAPCSTACLERLCEFFSVTVFYYNPNIYPETEYFHRVDEQKRFITEAYGENRVGFIEGEFEPKEFYAAVKGLENEPEGSLRCFECYRLRLEKTAQAAKENGFDYFTTTLTLSPLKNSAKLNEIGFEIAQKFGIKFLPSDFKKKNGFLRSTELSRQYGLYRQNYCGCVFSQRDKD